MATTINKVAVSIRVRPLVSREEELQELEFWKCTGNSIHYVLPGTRYFQKSYTYDHVFDQEIPTMQIYDQAVKQVVHNSFEGFNGAIMCYGQTSSGKTYTMYGNEKNPGLITLTASDIYRKIETNPSRQYFLRMTLLEIHNEKVWDHSTDEPKEVRQIFEDSNGVVVPRDADEIQIFTIEEMMTAAKRLQRARKVATTKLNGDSSRSHTIMSIRIESIGKPDLGGAGTSELSKTVTSSILNLVDLAGSEKVDQSGAVGDTFKEATKINTSLSALARVIQQLSHSSSSSSDISESHKSGSQLSKHIGFRNSKLTRLLQNSFAGNAYVSIICNVSPASMEETESTLRFADTAKTIKVRPKKNLNELCTEIPCNLGANASPLVQHDFLEKQDVANLVTKNLAHVQEQNRKLGASIVNLSEQKQDAVAQLISMNQALEAAGKKLNQQEQELISLRDDILHLKQERERERETCNKATFRLGDHENSINVAELIKDYEKVKGELQVLESWRRRCTCRLNGNHINIQRRSN